MPNNFTPIRDLGTQLQEQGRIRLGVKDPNRGMRSIDTFRFTSPDRSVIEQLAAIYGGVARPWSDPRANTKDQFEVITKANEIEVWLGADGLTQHYEYWTAGGCQRRCDGVIAAIPRGEDWADAACICNSERPPAKKDQCKPKTRMTVIIPQVRMAGGWRLETSSWNAAKEMPQMEQLVRSMQDRGLLKAKLRIEHGKSQTGGQTKRYTYPRLILDETPVAIMSGAADVRAITRADVEPTAAALEAGEVEPEVIDLGADMGPSRDELGNDVVDAEVIEEVEGWDTKQEAMDSGRPFKLVRGATPKYQPTD